MATKSGVAGPAMRLKFRYDYMGRRIRKNVYNAITGGTLQESRVYLYEGWNLVAEFDGSQSNALLPTPGDWISAAAARELEELVGY